jgi:RNA polymerase sigma-70 factor (ECF subfamily)
MTTDVNDALAQLWEAGRAAFPEARLDRDAFARFVLSKADAAPRIAALRGADLYLACACAAGDPRALAILEERYLARLPAALATRERSPAIVDEVKQLVRARLLVASAGAPPKIAEYGGTGALEGWLRVVALRVHGNLRRQDRDHEDIDAVTAPAQLAADPELLLLRERYQSAFDAALHDAFAALVDRDRAVFRMQFLKGLTLDQIALVFQVHRATAARWIAAARARLFASTTALLRERLGVDDRELTSLMGALGSQLEVSVNGLLRESVEG